MDLGLSGQRAIVTGGSGGIGKAIAESLAGEGCNVALIARRQERLEEVAAELSKLGAQAYAVSADLSTSEGIEAGFQQSAKALGGVDILVNCTGATKHVDAVDGDDEAFIDAMKFKYMSYVRMSRLAARKMREQGKGGSIVNISGVGGIQPFGAHLPGGAANSAVLLYSKGLGRQLAAEGIRVNAINPGQVDSARIQHLYQVTAEAEGVSLVEAEARLMAEVPSGRAVSPREVGDLAAYIASPRSASIVGEYINIDGGWTASM